MYPSTRQKTTWITEPRQHVTQFTNGVAASRVDIVNGQIEGDDRREEIETPNLPADAAYLRTPITWGKHYARTIAIIGKHVIH